MKRLSILFLMFLFSSCATIKTASYKLDKSESFSDKKTIRIVQISDFHSNDFGKNESRLIEKVRAASPDIIFLTGDIFDFDMKGIKPVQNVKYLLEGLRQIAPFYYITGNHEYNRYHNAEWSFLIEEYGGKTLKNESIAVEINNGIILVTGISDPFEDLIMEKRQKDKDDKEKYLQRLDEVSRKASQIKKEIQENPDFLLSVLLAHRPEYIMDYLSYDYDLILAGHAHGGQWKLPFAKNGLYAPMQGFFPKYSGGLYDFKKQGSVLIVSRGLSHQIPNIPRFFNPPELVVIEIR